MNYDDDIDSSRLDAISTCMDELERIRRDRTPEDWGAAIGEVDQLAELHRLLFI